MLLPFTRPCPGHRPQDTGQGTEQGPRGVKWTRRGKKVSRCAEDVTQGARRPKTGARRQRESERERSALEKASKWACRIKVKEQFLYDSSALESPNWPTCTFQLLLPLCWLSWTQESHTTIVTSPSLPPAPPSTKHNAYGCQNNSIELESQIRHLIME